MLRHLESLLVTTPDDFVVQYLGGQLPGVESGMLRRLKWCMQYINGKLGYTQWASGDTKELIIVTLDRDGNVRHWSSIVRRRNGATSRPASRRITGARRRSVHG